MDAAGFEHAGDLTQGCVEIRHMFQDFIRRHDVEAV